MNILYLMFSFTTGGAERLVADICNEMAKREHRVHLYIVNNSYDESMLAALSPKVCVYLQNRTAGGAEKLKTLLTVARYIREQKIDVVHCNSFSAPDLLYLKPFLFPKTKIIHTVHDVGQYRTLGKIKCGLRNLLCYRIIAISDCVKKDIITNGGAYDKVRTVYNAIDFERFHPRQRFDNDTICIGNVARIMPEKKGQDVLLRAMAVLYPKYPQLRCIFAGDADAEHQGAFSALKEMVREFGLEECVTFLGNVEDVPSFLATLDLFVLPSRFEGFGISLVEAMAMGIPCVASRLDGPAEVLSNGQYGVMFEPGNSADLADILEQMIKELSLFKEKSAKTVSYVKEKYDIIGMCNELENIMRT